MGQGLPPPAPRQLLLAGVGHVYPKQPNRHLPVPPASLLSRWCRLRRTAGGSTWWATRTDSSTTSAECELTGANAFLALLAASCLVGRGPPGRCTCGEQKQQIDCFAWLHFVDLLRACPCLACRLEVVGNPSPSNAFVFNGDFVDRGAWCAPLLPYRSSCTLPLRLFVLLPLVRHTHCPSCGACCRAHTTPPACPPP